MPTYDSVAFYAEDTGLSSLTLAGMTLNSGSIIYGNLSLNGNFVSETFSSPQAANVAVSGISITERVSFGSGSVWTFNDVTITNLPQYSAAHGGAVSNTGGALYVYGGSFSGNSTGGEKRGGAIYSCDPASLYIMPVIKDGVETGAVFTLNVADGLGGAVFSSGQTYIKGATFSYNRSVSSGSGAMYVKRGYLENSYLQGNSSSNGGAVGAYPNANQTFSFSGNDFLDNVATNQGGAVWFQLGTVNFNGDTFDGNTAASAGGAIYGNNGTLNISDAVFTENIVNGSSSKGGAVYANSDTAIADSVFERNSAVAQGGALFVNAVDTVVTDTQFEQNSVSAADGKGGAAYVSGSGDAQFDGADFAENSSTYFGGAVYAEGALEIKNSLFDQNSALNQGGAVFVNTAGASVSGSTFSGNKTTSTVDRAAIGGAVYLAAGKSLTVSGSTFTGNSAVFRGGAVYSDGTLTIDGAAFDGNSASSGGAVWVGAASQATLKGELKFLQASDTVNVANTGVLNVTGAQVIQNSQFRSSGTLTIDKSNFSGADATSNESDGGAVISYSTLQITDSEFKQFTTGKQGGAINASGDAMISGATFTGNKAVDADGLGGAVYAASGKTVTINGSTFTGNSSYRGGAVYSLAELTIDGGVFDGNSGSGGAVWVGAASQATLQGKLDFMQMSDTVVVASSGELTIKDANILLNSDIAVYGSADITGNVTLTSTVDTAKISGSAEAQFSVTDAVLTFANSDVFKFSNGMNCTVSTSELVFANNGALNMGKLTLDDESSMTFGGSALVNFSSLDLSGIAITVDGARFTDKAVTIATGVTAIGDYTITNSTPFLELEVVDNNLVLKEVEAVISGETEVASLTGNGVNVISGGKITSVFFAEKTNSADVIATKASAGEISNLIGGAYAKATDDGFTKAEIGKVELDIAGSADIAERVYAGGYFYGNGSASDTVQMTVDSVNVNLAGGKASGNVYGGVHARQNGNVSVAEVAITITSGEHGRVYGGGWAEGNAKSNVDKAIINISGGTVDYVYGGGANADGKTYVGTSNITISGDAVVNTIFMGGRYGYSYVDTVNLTFADDAKELKRLSGVSSAGMDYADATVVELETNVTADLIDYVDKFVINEDCTLTANDAFYLGNRTAEGETAGVTTFDFIAEGEANWTAVAGIDDFTNAKFAVNGAGLTDWDGSAAIEIGGYELTYDAKDKTIKLAQITA